MKQIWVNLKTKEHQRALLTVSIVFMSSILFFLLASLETPIKPEVRNDLPLEISSFELSSSVRSDAVSSPASNAKIQQEESMPKVDLKTKISEENNVKDVFSFSSTGTEHTANIFGKDDLALRSNILTPNNRTVLKSPTFNVNTQEEGTIGLNIWVDEDG